MGFIRVRSADGPSDEYEVPEGALKARPGAYVRVDSGVEPAPADAGVEVAKVTRKGARK